MIRTIRILTAASVAALASTAMATPAAHAEVTKFTAGASSGSLRATQTAKLVTSTVNGKIECTSVTMSGTYTSATFSSVTMSPLYEGCKAFGFLSVTVSLNGCTYGFAGKEGTETLATETINCPAGQAIVWSTPGCTTRFGAQGALNHVKLSNNTTKAPDDVDATFTVSGITYTAEGCATNGAFSNGTLEGGATFVASDTTGAQVNLTVDP